MKTAIVYISRHGTTEKVARFLAEKEAGEEVCFVNLRKKRKPSLESFDRIILGGSIHAGSVNKKIKTFCQKNLNVLLQKEVGLFICCLLKEQEKEQFENAFPKKLRDHSKVNGIFGGEFLFERMNFIERFIVRKFAHIDHTVSRLDYNAIHSFIKDFRKN